jgi:uncharacterized membrane protein YfcA
MEVIEGGAILLAGIAAGGINAVVGSGTLITFPILLAFGYPPVVANISNNVGLVFGGVSATWGYRRELAGQGRRMALLAPLSLCGAVTGALLLLALPATAFETVVPILLCVALALVLVQPRMQVALSNRRALRGGSGEGPGHWFALMGGTYGAGAYGGYFGAAQGVLLVGLLGSLLPESLQRVNAVKNALSLVVNVVSALTFTVVAFDRIDWRVVALIAVGSSIGGWLGAKAGRRLPDGLLRAVIMVIGAVAIWRIVAA